MWPGLLILSSLSLQNLPAPGWWRLRPELPYAVAVRL